MSCSLHSLNLRILGCDITDYLLPQIAAIKWFKELTKKFQAPIHPEDPLPVPKYGQIRTKATFDRKVVEIQFFNQNIHDEISLYIFLSLESFCSKMLS